MKSHAAHLIIAVKDGKASKAFYKKLAAKIGWKVTYEEPDGIGISDGVFTLWVVPAEKKTKHEFKGVGYHHLAVRVGRKKDVDDVYAWCKRNKIVVADAPASYPQYAKGYYAVFFLDPDGMKVEVLFATGPEKA